MRDSLHYDGKKFHNLEPSNATKTFWNILKWRLTRRRGAWPKWYHPPVAPEPVNRIKQTDKALITFINHATVLIQTAGLNILTDPIWSQRCSPVSWAGPKRIHDPGIAFQNLPPIDIVLISHDHYDHLDLPTLIKLQHAFKPQFYSGLGVNDYLRKKKAPFNVIDMDWLQTQAPRADIQLSFVPARHWSGRSPFKNNRTLWGGFVLKTPQLTLYYSGDTASGTHFQQIAARFPRLDLAILPIGAYEPRWFMHYAHMNPTEAVQAHKTLNSRYSLGVHFNTFAELSDETFDQPRADLAAALAEHNVPSTQFRTLEPGAQWEINAE